MRHFSSVELGRMRTTQECAMQDTCRILVYSATVDGYGNPSPTYTAGEAIDCGLAHINPREVQGTGEVPLIDARLRLPITTTIDERDRVEITHRYGVALTETQIFEIVGPPQVGPSGLVLSLRAVDDV